MLKIKQKKAGSKTKRSQKSNKSLISSLSAMKATLLALFSNTSADVSLAAASPNSPHHAPVTPNQVRSNSRGRAPSSSFFVHHSKVQ
jgi:hypothetical protein